MCQHPLQHIPSYKPAGCCTWKAVTPRWSVKNHSSLLRFSDVRAGVSHHGCTVQPIKLSLLREELERGDWDQRCWLSLKGFEWSSPVNEGWRNQNATSNTDFQEYLTGETSQIPILSRPFKTGTHEFLIFDFFSPVFLQREHVKRESDV